MRIRAAVLLAEVLGPQTIPLDSMDSIITDVISSAQARWLSYAKRTSEVLLESELQNTSLIIGQNILFQTLLMLHA